MGFFDPKKTVTVASVVYNLAGDVNDRPDFLKTTVQGAAISDSNLSIAETLQKSYIGGPGIKFRSFGRWSRTSGYSNTIGQNGSYISMGNSLDRDTLIAQIPHGVLETVTLQSAEIGVANYAYWAEQYMAVNHPTLLNTGWTTNFDEGTNEIQILSSAGFDTFTPVGFQNGAIYVYAKYSLVDADGVWSNLKVFIYRNNSGNPILDVMFTVPDDGGRFFPFIPLRLNNSFIDDGNFDDLYEGAKKALKRGTNTTFAKLKEKINDNPNIGDIDYAYIVYGVALNTKENACKRYLYEFFQEVMLGRDLSGSEYATWQTNWAAAQASWATWKIWSTAQANEEDPLFGTTEPERIPYPEPPMYSIDITSAGHPHINYGMHLEWHGIRETVHSGSPHPQGEAWVENVGSTDYAYDAYTDGSIFNLFASVDTIRIGWQQDSDTYRTLEISGLTHRNTIYGGKSVDITASEALADSDESGFIIPLHEGVFRRTSLVQATQMSTACCYIVFNCYTIVKEKWYQSTWFKIVLVIAIIIITIVSGGSGVGSVGLLGANATVGASIGLTGTAAVIAGAIANAVAAMIVVQIITSASKAIFGEKIGQIVGLIASMVVIQAGTSFMSGSGISLNFAELVKPENLLRLSMAAGEGYSAYLRADTMETVGKIQEETATAEKEMSEITKLSEEVFGVGTGGVLNPLTLTDIGRTLSAETRDSFLARTTLVGSDISELSMDMLTRFAEITLSTKLPT